MARDEGEVELLREPSVGLGIGAQGQEDWVADKMAHAQEAYHPSSSSIASPSLAVSLKRGHLDLDAEEGDEVESDEDDAVGSKVRIVDSEAVMDPDDWVTNVDEDEEGENERLLEMVKKEFDEQLDFWDTTMVAEYSEEIFDYMSELEVRSLLAPLSRDVTDPRLRIGEGHAQPSLHGAPERD